MAALQASNFLREAVGPASSLSFGAAQTSGSDLIIGQSAALRGFEGLRLQSSAYERELVGRAGKTILSTNSTAIPSQNGALTVQAVATPVKPTSPAPPKRSKVEIYKEESDFLRHPLLEELQSPAANINAAAEQLIKFHGSYQQENRELRKEGGRTWQFMMRTRQPGGKVDNQLYKTMDDMANKFGNGTLRLTTRQTFQLHGILKENMKTVFSSVIKNMGSTLGACGDLNRNILAPVAPYNNRPDYKHCQELSDNIAALLAPQAGAYYDVWMDGEKVLTSEPPEVTEARMDNSHGTNFEGSPEPIYGTQFLPRKFKIAITVPGDNSVDLLTNDVGIVVLSNDDGVIHGYNIYVGGGMGRSHRNDATFPSIAQPLGYVPKADILYAVKAIVATQRDNGRRDDRKQARMKYLIHEWGIEKFRSEAEKYYGKKFETFKELPPWEFKAYVGWGEQGDGKLFYGLHIDNGRIKGDAKKAIREVVEKYDLPVRISANQNLVLCDIRPAWRSRITKALAPVGILGAQYVDPLNLTGMACPALPLCGLAITEAERFMPDTLKMIRGLLDKVGLRRAQESLVVRMTGCPNGCARPYMAELGLVGDGANSYQLWLGGGPAQTRLARVFLERVKVQELEATLEPLFCMWKLQRTKGEAFGDFTERVGFEAMKEFMTTYKNPRQAQALGRPKRAKGGPPPARIAVDPLLMGSIREAARDKGVSASKLATDAIAQYLGVELPEVEEGDVAPTSA